MLAATLDAIPDLLFVVSPDGRICDYHSPRTDLLAARPEEFIGRLMYEFIPAEAAAVVQEAIEEAHDSGRSLGKQYLLPLPIGDRWFELSVCPMPISALQEPRYIILSRDITERKELEAQLLRSQRFESACQLAGGIAHEFNNLLTGIIVQVALLRDGRYLAQEDKERLERISQSAHRAADLIRKMLVYCRQRTPDRHATDLNTFVRQLADSLGKVAGAKVRVNLELTAQPQPVLVDADMIGQLLLHLVSNARDAMPAGGLLTIHTKTCLQQSRSKSAFIAAEGGHHRRVGDAPALAGEYTCLCVEDGGCGMTPETINRLCEPFFSTKEVGQGTGLGLATAYSIAYLHQGWLEFISRPGRGTTACVLLPRTREPIIPGTALSATILLVAGEPLINGLLQNTLARAGHSVVAVPTPAEVRTLWPIQRDRVRLIIVDLTAGRSQDALALANDLLADQPGLRVLFLRGDEGQAAPELACFGSAANILTKPFATEELLQLTKTLLAAS